MDFEFIEGTSKYHDVMKFSGDEMTYGVIIDGEMKSLWSNEFAAALGADACADLRDVKYHRFNRDDFPEVKEAFEKFLYSQSEFLCDLAFEFLHNTPEELLDKGWEDPENYM